MRKKVMYALPLLLVVSVIVTASSMSYEQQDLREYINRLPLEWVEHALGSISFTYSTGTVSIEEKGTAGFIEFFIRKGTHFVVYGLMMIGSYLALIPYRINFVWKIITSYLFITLFAVIDELRHFYHPDRTGLWQDIVLDMTGGLFAVLVIVIDHHRTSTKGR
ncbi:VanZ family protein [Alteribacillus iranensis]|uniref:VanZ like family protein n=1 Tax=Alteribacillus iranensis TaxID=930128 RepID=A0A1I2B0Q8_9BACI|nr:VanZ family protein [Alteribacillus iranensis]SFE49629.1 VanZ like family protein [Alteribacillus iranensis]